MIRTTLGLIFVSYIQFATSIRCYDCNSANNSMCLDLKLYDKESLKNFLKLTDCRQGVHAVAPEGEYDFFCRKIQQTILRKDYEPEVRVTRGCGWKRSHKDCYKADNEDHLEIVCQCFTDSCNGAANLTVNLCTAVVAFAVSLALRFK